MSAAVPVILTEGLTKHFRSFYTRRVVTPFFAGAGSIRVLGETGTRYVSTATVDVEAGH